MSAIPMSGKDAIVKAFKNTHDARPGDRDSGYELLATNLTKCVAMIAFGVGDPTDAGVAETALFYCDTGGGKLWVKLGSWKLITTE